LINIGDGLGEAPPGRGVKIETREDSQTGADLHTVTFDDWGARWTPVVLEFDAAITSGRGRGSCYLALPQLIGVDTPAVDDAAAAASGAPSVFDLKRRPRGAATFGRVIVRTGGRLLDGEARPTPDFVDGNPWVSGLGDIGEEAAVWRCEAAAARDQWPQIGTPNRKSDELALPTDATENDDCAGLAVIEARNSDTFRDAALLIVGGIFSLLLGAIVKGAFGAALAARGEEPESTS